MRITDSLLKREGACPDQRKLFRKLYPRGANTTVASLRKSFQEVQLISAVS